MSKEKDSNMFPSTPTPDREVETPELLVPPTQPDSPVTEKSKGKAKKKNKKPKSPKVLARPAAVIKGGPKKKPAAGTSTVKEEKSAKKDDKEEKSAKKDDKEDEGNEQPVPKAKAKPKAKGKAKGKGKGKGKGKESTKGKGKGKVIKNVNKKPAAKNESKEKPKKATKEEPKKEQEEDGEEERKEIDECVDVDPFEMQGTSEKLDRSKANKFKKMAAEGQLPEWLLEEYKKILKRSTGKRDALRYLINTALDNQQGRLVLNTTKPEFMLLQKSWKESTSAEVEKSLPRRLLQGKFRLSDESFEQALAEGDIVEVETKTGKIQYAWASSSHTTRQGKLQEQGFTKKAEGSVKDGQAMSLQLNFKKIGLFQAKGDSSGSRGPETQAIEDQKEAPLSKTQWREAKTQLKDAIEAFDKLLRDATKKLQELQEGKSDPVYGGLCLGLQTVYSWGLLEILVSIFKVSHNYKYHLDIYHLARNHLKVYTNLF